MPPSRWWSWREECFCKALKHIQGLNHNPEPSVWCLLLSTPHLTRPTRTQRRVRGRCREAVAINIRLGAVGYSRNASKSTYSLWLYINIYLIFPQHWHLSWHNFSYCDLSWWRAAPWRRAPSPNGPIKVTFLNLGYYCSVRREYLDVKHKTRHATL